MSLLPGPGLSAALGGLTSNAVALGAGQNFLLGPTAGLYALSLSKYHNFQQRDPITGTWRNAGSSNGSGLGLVYSDGVNYRIANTTGCAVGALLTNQGSGYTSAPLVTPSFGASLWSAIVGGAVSTSVTIINGGADYTYAPTVWIAPPSPGGIQATAVCSLAGGSAVASVTIVDQGAGYAQAPQIVFINDPRELNNPSLTTGYGASAALSLTGSGTVTGVLCLDHGLPGSAVPTLAFSGGGGSSAAALTLMNLTVTAFAIGTAGGGLAGSFAEVTALDQFPPPASAYTNPTTQSNLVNVRPASIQAAISGGGLTLTGSNILDGGAYSRIPTPIVMPSASIVTTAPVVTFTMGGANGVSYVTPIGA